MKRFSFDELIWFFTLILLVIFNVYLLVSGEIYNFINGNMLKVFIISIIILCIFTIFQIKMIFSIPSRNYFTNKFIPLIFVLIVAVIFFAPAILNKANDNDFIINNSNKDVIKIDNSNYHFIEEIENMPILYKDKFIQMTGFIYVDEENKTYIAREELSCCQWDMHMIKIPIEGEDFLDKKGSWITILASINDKNYLSLKIVDFKYCKEPEERFFHDKN